MHVIKYAAYDDVIILWFAHFSGKKIVQLFIGFQVVGFDLVDDESKPERRPTKHMPTPAQWTNIFNPAFSYYTYYCYANLYTLNKVSFKPLPA